MYRSKKNPKIILEPEPPSETISDRIKTFNIFGEYFKLINPYDSTNSTREQLEIVKSKLVDNIAFSNDTVKMAQVKVDDMLLDCFEKKTEFTDHCKMKFKQWVERNLNDGQPDSTSEEELTYDLVDFELESDDDDHEPTQCHYSHHHLNHHQRQRRKPQITTTIVRSKPSHTDTLESDGMDRSESETESLSNAAQVQPLPIDLNVPSSSSSSSTSISSSTPFRDSRSHHHHTTPISKVNLPPEPIESEEFVNIEEPMETLDLVDDLEPVERLDSSDNMVSEEPVERVQPAKTNESLTKKPEPELIDVNDEPYVIDLSDSDSDLEIVEVPSNDQTNRNVTNRQNTSCLVNNPYRGRMPPTCRNRQSAINRMHQPNLTSSPKNIACCKPKAVVAIFSETFKDREGNQITILVHGQSMYLIPHQTKYFEPRSCVIKKDHLNFILPHLHYHGELLDPPNVPDVLPENVNYPRWEIAFDGLTNRIVIIDVQAPTSVLEPQP